MLSFLFWNLMNRDLRPVVAEAVNEHEVDILALAECIVPDDEMAAVLASVTGDDFAPVSYNADKVRVFTRLPANRWVRRQTDAVSARTAIWTVRAGRSPAIVLAVAHLPSKASLASSEQALLAVELAKEIHRVEEFVGHERTLLVGDLNMNPFDDGVIGAPALHAVMTRRLAERTDRRVQGNRYRFFYNPMWGFFGDRTKGPPGTYFHRSAGVAELYWHMLDQVLLRPALMHRLRKLAILERIGSRSLLTSKRGVPHSSVCSDHLPLTFSLDLD